MFVRLALEDEAEDIVEMARENSRSTCPEEYPLYDPDMVRATFQRYLDTAESTFFVLENKGRIVGFLQAYMLAYDYRPGLYTVQKVLYVKPEKRGSRGAVLLMKMLIEWTKTVGADRIEGGNDNSFNSERTATFLEHFGFRKVGYAMRLELG
jgi:GNAT superfamily N-acetyltransferase